MNSTSKALESGLFASCKKFAMNSSASGVFMLSSLNNSCKLKYASISSGSLNTPFPRSIR